MPDAGDLIKGKLVMKQWNCELCGFVYDEKAGMPNEGIAPGTTWDHVPEDWTCPDCSAPKSDFASVET